MSLTTRLHRSAFAGELPQPLDVPNGRPAEESLVLAVEVRGVVVAGSPGSSQHPLAVPIPGTMKRHRLEENVVAAEVGLTAEDLRDINEAAAELKIQGARYPESAQRMIDR